MPYRFIALGFVGAFLFALSVGHNFSPLGQSQTANPFKAAELGSFPTR